VKKVGLEPRVREREGGLHRANLFTNGRPKIAKVFMTHVQDFFRKSLSKATFERKLSGVSLP